MIKKLTVPILDATLFLVQDKDLTDVRIKFGLSADELAEGVAGWRKDDDGYVYMLAVDEPRPDIVAHEALHVIHFIMRDKGMKADVNNDEWECYALSWIIQQCYKYFDTGESIEPKLKRGR